MRGALAAFFAAASLSGSSAGAAPMPTGTLAWGPGSVIAFNANDGAYVISPDGTGLRKLTSKQAPALAFSPDGKTLLLGGGGGTLYTMPASGGALHSVGKGIDGVWSPDGKKLAVLRQDGYYLMRSTGAGAHKLITDRYPQDLPAWSPDGTKLAIELCTAPFLSQPCEHQYGFDVYTIDANGTGKTRITPKSGNPQCVAWSKAGKLAFLTTDNTVAIVQANGTLRTFRPAGCPVWSPNGLTYAVPQNTAVGAVGFLNASGTGRRVVTVVRRGEEVAGVVWSPDGKQLAILVDTLRSKSPYQIWVMNTNGSGLKKLV
jgi:Tol biopolymer transport system component